MKPIRSTRNQCVIDHKNAPNAEEFLESIPLTCKFAENIYPKKTLWRTSHYQQNEQAELLCVQILLPKGNTYLSSRTDKVYRSVINNRSRQAALPGNKPILPGNTPNLPGNTPAFGQHPSL